ncbi:hypothetical protein ACFL6P_06305 [Candidatus Latescibacterota bacterium]
MQNIQHIIAIAKVEALLQLRSKPIRYLFGISSIVVLNFLYFYLIRTFNIYSPLIPGTLAVKSFFWLSLFKIMLSPFIVPSFIREDAEQNTFMSLSVRPFTNESYFLGKIFGYTGVMIVSDYIFMFVLFVSALIFNGYSTSVWPFLLYPIIITIPLSIFVFGFCTLLATIRYHLTYLSPIVMILFFLPLEDLESTRFLDLGAVTLPLAYSMVTGFADMQYIVIQRLIFVSAGIGMILGASLLLEFRRRSITRNRGIFVSSVIVLCLVFTTGFVWLDQKPIKDGILYRSKLRDHHNASADHVQVKVEACSLAVEHIGSEIDVTARLTISNPNVRPVDNVLLSLNPGFSVTDISPSADFQHELGIIRIQLYEPLKTGEQIVLDIAYRGSVDQTATYIHIPEDFRERNRRSGFNVLNKQTAIIEREYVMLPAEVNWYPAALSTYKVSEPGYLQRTLTEYSMSVKPCDGLIVISQGRKEEITGGTYKFTPELPLTQISLTAGPYKKKSITVDDVEYSYYMMQNGIISDLGITQKKLERFIRITQQNITYMTGLDYPFKRYSIVQTPVHYFGYNSPLALSGGYEQPEIKLVPEYPILLDRYAFYYNSRNYNSTLYTSSRLNSKYEGPEQEYHQARVLFEDFYFTKTNSRAIGRKIRPSSSIHTSTGLLEFSTNPFAVYGNTLSQVAVFSCGPVSSNDYFNAFVFNWLRSKLPSDRNRGISRAMSLGSTFYHSLNRAEFDFLETKSLNDIILNEQFHTESLDILITASKCFFRLFAGKSGTDLYLIERTISDSYKTQTTDLIKALNRVCSSDVLAEFTKYANQRNTAHYEISDISVSEHIVDNRQLYNLRFIVSNPTEYPGFVSFRTGRYPYFSDKDVFIESYAKKEVGLVTEEKPNHLTYQWVPFGTEDRKVIIIENLMLNTDHTELFDSVRIVESEKKSLEIIIDNLDDGCRIVSNKKLKFIQRFLGTRWKDGADLRIARYRGYNAPPEWTLAQDSFDKPFYGPYCSVYYRKAGNGETAIEYNVFIPEKGEYELYLSVPSRSTFSQSRVTPLLESGDLGETNVRVFADDGMHEDTTDISKADGEWAYVGTYSFPDTTAVIQITDKTKAKIVIADAVKLRKAN